LIFSRLYSSIIARACASRSSLWRSCSALSRGATVFIFAIERPLVSDSL
jgi:hypothetical protein